jgi:hypothetical protein
MGQPPPNLSCHFFFFLAKDNSVLRVVRHVTIALL